MRGARTILPVRDLKIRLPHVSRRNIRYRGKGRAGRCDGVMSMGCKLTSTCPFFGGALDLKPQTAALFRARYCRGNHAECARFLIFAARGREAVPHDLSPNDRLRALHILRAETEDGNLNDMTHEAVA